jgi:hypothetical protein
VRTASAAAGAGLGAQMCVLYFDPVHESNYPPGRAVDGGRKTVVFRASFAVLNDAHSAE